jgi:hypothetical protein
VMLSRDLRRWQHCVIYDSVTGMGGAVTAHPIYKTACLSHAAFANENERLAQIICAGGRSIVFSAAAAAAAADCMMTWHCTFKRQFRSHAAQLDVPSKVLQKNNVGKA